MRTEALGLVVLGVVIGTMIAAYVGFRLMPRLQTLLPREFLRRLRPAVGEGDQPSWRTVERRIIKRLTPVVGIDGVRQIPVRFEVSLAPTEFAVLGERVAAMEAELVRALRVRAKKGRWDWHGDPEVWITASDEVVEGFPEVTSYLTRRPTGDDADAVIDSPSADPPVAGLRTASVPIDPAATATFGFTAPGSEAGEPPADATRDAAVTCVVLESPSGERWQIELTESRDALVGRRPGSTIQLDDPYVSARHARIFLDPESQAVVVEDLGSRNGTYLDGAPVSSRTVLTPSSWLRFGAGGADFSVGTPS